MTARDDEAISLTSQEVADIQQIKRVMLLASRWREVTTIMRTPQEIELHAAIGDLDATFRARLRSQ